MANPLFVQIRDMDMYKLLPMLHTWILVYSDFCSSTSNKEEGTILPAPEQRNQESMASLAFRFGHDGKKKPNQAGSCLSHLSEHHRHPQQPQAPDTANSHRHIEITVSTDDYRRPAPLKTSSR